MANFFNPNSPQFRRGVFITSVYSVTIVGTHLLFADFGTQEHIFSPIQRYFIPKIDAFFGVTDEEIKRGLPLPLNSKPQVDPPSPPPTTTAKVEPVPPNSKKDEPAKPKGWLW